jgi:hypothetical protein
MADGWLKLSFDSPKLDALREELEKKASRIHETFRQSFASAHGSTRGQRSPDSGLLFNKKLFRQSHHLFGPLRLRDDHLQL